jgi:hypothetical protein
MSYFSHIKQEIVADANNSSNTNLAVGNSYTFTGTLTSTLGVAGIQVSLYADKNCIVKVQQSPSATPNWDLTDTYYYTASSNFGVTVQAISSYIRVVVTTMSETTGTFRLQTVLCPIVEVVPRSLDPLGNFKVTLQSDRFGNPIENSNLGELQTVKRVRLVGTQFDGNTLDPNFWNTSILTGTITQTTANVTITSGTANGHYATLWSNRKARFVTGTSNKYRSHIRLADTGTANVRRRWGVANISNYSFAVSGTPNVVAGNVYTNNSQTFIVGITANSVTDVTMIGTGAPAASGTLTQVVGSGGNLTFTSATAQAVVVDGAFFELDGTTFSVVTYKGGSESKVSSGSFNGQLGYTYAPTTNNTIYEIAYGNGSVTFIIGQVPVHKVTASTATWTGTIHLNIFASVRNSGNSSAVAFYSRAMNITRIGELETAPKTQRIIGNAATYVLKYGPGRLHKIIYNNTTGTSLTVYDDITANANIIGVITTATAALGSWAGGIDFYWGLTLKTIGNDLDATIVYE